MESHSFICDSCFRDVEVLLRTTLTLHHPAFTGYEFLSTYNALLRTTSLTAGNHTEKWEEVETGGSGIIK